MSNTTSIVVSSTRQTPSTFEEKSTPIRASTKQTAIESRPQTIQLRSNPVRSLMISSLAGLFAGPPSVAGYTVGKHALIGLTRTLARDYGKHGVRVNAVCPGWVQTPMADEEMDEFAAHAGG